MSGRIQESVLKRSVLKFLQSHNENVESGAGVGKDCAIFSCKDKVCSAGDTMSVKCPSDIRILFWNCVSRLACAGAEPVAVHLNLMLPEEFEEADLKEIIKQAEGAAARTGAQIAGVNVASSDGVGVPVACITMTGSGFAPEKSKSKSYAGCDLIVTGYIGLAGTALAAEKYTKELTERYPLHMIEGAVSFGDRLYRCSEAAPASKSGVRAMHSVTEGGIFAALWELAEATDTGLTAELKKIPIKQETVEVCERLELNPYELLSDGCFLIACEHGEALVQELAEAGIPASLIGQLTDSRDRVLLNEEEKRFLERPRHEEIWKIL